MLKVLIAEDELMIADMLEYALVEDGYAVCGIARTVDEAVTLFELHRPDLAILDVRLANGGRGPDIIRRISGKGKVGILYATGDDARISALTFADGEGVIVKPYETSDVLQALKIVRDVVADAAITRPLPTGFRLLHEATANTPRNSRA